MRRVCAPLTESADSECRVCKSCSYNDGWDSHDSICHVSHSYRSELSKHELADCDFDELIYRGLSAQAIEAIGFKTLTGTMDVPYTKSVKGKPLWLLHGDNYL